tara:strand:+ start:2203 stop:2781 length:579 start_codon:yes stop_codon:yes gene_type:complete
VGKYNLSEEIIVNLFEKEPIDIWVNSFGGCRSNYIRDCIKDKYTTYNQAYEIKACHYIRPLDVQVSSGIFCYTEDVGIAISSQLRRKMYWNFQKLMEGNNEVPFNVGTWLDNIDKQIDNWTKPSHFPILIINTDVIVDYKDKFKEIYDVEMLPFKTRRTSEYINEITPYSEKIEKINNKLINLPDFLLNKNK